MDSGEAEQLARESRPWPGYLLIVLQRLAIPLSSQNRCGLW